MKTIYALLVGIDDYPPPVPKLRGCVNDIKEMEAVSRKPRVEPGEGRTLDEALKVKDAGSTGRQPATRSSRPSATTWARPARATSPCSATAATARRSRPPRSSGTSSPTTSTRPSSSTTAGPRARGTWPTRSWPSSSPRSPARGPHVVVLLDCCHSGSGTRDSELAETAVRRAQTDLAPTAARQLHLHASTSCRRPARTRDLAARPSGWDAAGRHVLLAACRDDEEAKEYQGGGATRGAFSYFLGETLRTVGGAITYRSLFDRAAALVRGQVQRQTPQLEATDRRGPAAALPRRGDPAQPPVLRGQPPGRPLDDRRRPGPRHPRLHPGRRGRARPVRLRGGGRGPEGPGQGPRPGEGHPRSSAATSQLESSRGSPTRRPGRSRP